jgi:hypothetical protein
LRETSFFYIIVSTCHSTDVEKVRYSELDIVSDSTITPLSSLLAVRWGRVDMAINIDVSTVGMPDISDNHPVPDGVNYDYKHHSR